MSMTCQQYREAHPAGTAEARAHLASCADCRAFAESWDLLREYPALEPSAGFFQGVRRKLAPRILRFAAALSAAAAALLLGIVLVHQPPPKPPVVAQAVTEEERQILEHWELLQNYDLVRVLDVVSTGAPLVEDKK
jgi:hypothetical protein